MTVVAPNQIALFASSVVEKECKHLPVPGRTLHLKRYQLRMAGIRSCTWGRPLHIAPPINKRADGGFCCCSISPNGKSKEPQTPPLLKIAVQGATELLRLFIPSGPARTALVDNELKDEISVSNVNDVLSIIRSDYEKAYFVTGVFTSDIYAEDCMFEDPTIKFQGS